MPGIKVTDEDRQTIPSKYFCALCKLLLHVPFQTMCGHLMCQSCVENLLKSPNPKCPEDGEELSQEKFFRDAFTARDVKRLLLHCTNPGCSWHSTYEQLEAHSQVCEHALIECTHPQCKMKLQRSQINEHLRSECEYRNVKCNYCQEDVPFASLGEHVQSTCEGAPVTCKHCGENAMRRDIGRHETHVCIEGPASCEFNVIGCHESLKRKELPQHANHGLQNHVSLLLQYVFDSVSHLGNYIPRPEFTRILQEVRDAIQAVRSSVAEKFFALVGKVTSLGRRIEALESSGGSDSRLRNEVSSEASPERGMTLERQLQPNTSTNDRLQSRLDQIGETQRGPPLLETRVEILETRVKILESHIPLEKEGTLLWKIEGYQRKRQDAINGVKTALYSPPFYSAQFGFKMCAKIYMNGDGFGKGSHLSLFFVVMRGEYDALQTWPFQKKITMMLLDQGNGDHMIDAFHSDPQSSSFQRPKSDMNIAFGSTLFMSLNSLNNRQYIKDDVMFIKIIVD